MSTTSQPFDGGDFAYGTWRVLDDATNVPSPTELATRFELCLENGIDVIDTAEIYGIYAVEAAIGQALQTAPELKQKLRFVTKAGIDIPCPEKPHAALPQYDASAQNLVASAEKSLQLLGVEVLDLFLVHRPDWLTPPEDTAKGLTQLLEQGKVRQVGVSNYTIHQFATLNALLAGQLATNQVEFSPFHMDPMYDGAFDQCLQLGIRPMAWSPLAGGTLFDQENPDSCRLLDKLQELSPDYANAPVDALIYAWLLAHPAHPTIILGTNKAERIPTSVLASNIKLKRNDWYAIWTAATGKSVP